MKIRYTKRLLLGAVLGLTFSSVVAHAQLVITLSELATFAPAIGGSSNSATNTGVVNATQTVRTGTGVATVNPPGNPYFTVSYDPLTDPIPPLNLSSGFATLNTGNFLFDSPNNPVNYFTSDMVTINYDFNSDSIFDLTQQYTINLSPFNNGIFTGVNYSIVPVSSAGTVVIGGTAYGYQSVVSGDSGTLFDGSHATASVQFQFAGFSPVPEPSTYAMFGVASLVGIVALRRRFGSSAPKQLLLAA